MRSDYAYTSHRYYRVSEPFHRCAVIADIEDRQFKLIAIRSITSMISSRRVLSSEESGSFINRKRGAA